MYLFVFQLVLNLTFMEAVRGCTKQVALRIQATCERCGGSGGEPGTKEQICPYCRGRGEVSISWRLLEYTEMFEYSIQEFTGMIAKITEVYGVISKSLL